MWIHIKLWQQHASCSFMAVTDMKYLLVNSCVMHLHDYYNGLRNEKKVLTYVTSKRNSTKYLTWIGSAWQNESFVVVLINVYQNYEQFFCKIALYRDPILLVTIADEWMTNGLNWHYSYYCKHVSHKIIVN